MTKRILVLGAAMLVLISMLSFTVFATGEEASYDEVTCEIVEGSHDPDMDMGITRDNHVVVNEDLTSRTGYQSVSFRTSSDYPYYRIYVLNSSRESYNITLTDESGRNQLAESPYVLAGGQSVILKNENAAPGMRYLGVTSPSGSSLSGRVSVRVASTADEPA